MNNKDMPAMPIFGESGYISTDYTGLTKREMFAMAAMQSYIAEFGLKSESSTLVDVPKRSWAMADAMLDKEW